MTQEEIYRYINALAGTDRFGGSFNMKEYNDAQKEVNITMFNDCVDKAFSISKNGILNIDAIYRSNMLSPFIMETQVSVSGGVVNLNTISNLAYILDGIRTTSQYRGQIRDVPIILYNEVSKRQSNLLSPNPKHNPYCYNIYNYLYVIPQDITSIVLPYLKYPSTPIFDYYIDANDNIVFMPASSTHVLTTGETGSSGETSPTNVVSKTVELEWRQEYHWQYINLLLKRLGFSNNDINKLQTTLIEENKISTT